MQAMALLGSKEVETIGVVWCSVTGEGSQHSVSAWCHTDPVPNLHGCASTALSPMGCLTQDEVLFLSCAWTQLVLCLPEDFVILCTA